MRRGSVGPKGAVLILLIGAGFQMLSAGVASAANNGPGTITVTPTAVGPGSTNNTFTFTYVPGTQRLVDGTVKVAIPTGWTNPEATLPLDPGFARTNRGT